ncbi:hypothetical protein Q1J52_05800 [Pseudomonas lijiangensis]|uniref:Glycosyltransferase RgtA/B/C/D-like domain-containing protein n=1 Tax=Pseudomonas cichorii TaxID=36746 RepID=A0A3M4WDP9_PSECI|nr:hypothetical protein [Pseudomonas cichorii]RMR62244.1 hypothetical protein ALP84_200083 [Pseudomonas cichorii]GFM66295.1 hypothetical protein PSCICJ_24130 [Pseudomonas cichorii]GFM77506.1 hypothetical protein PSCICM_33250 [Pseudomonas cichorii]
MNLALIKFIIVAALLGLALCFIRTEWLRRSLKARLKTDLPEHTLFSGCVLIVFMLFTALGLTGSSLDLGVRQSAFIESDMTRVWGHEQPIRSDEWLVLTPMAIAQSQHVPRYPVVNDRLGLDGQNMLVTGMTGLPVAHVSSLAKPAVWGFFVFDLKRALAWYWWFPVFGCLLALAHVLHTLSPGRWRQSFLFSLLFVSAPYIVAWSFWPAYAVFFPCIALLCLLKILQSRRRWTLVPLSILAGLAIAGFVLLLYPPWQVTIGYVFIALIIGIAIRDRLHKNLTLESILALVLALSVAGFLLASWWLSAREAIEAMMNTVYPGQRNLEAGGDVTWQALLKGYTNIVTLQRNESRPVNQSEMASFYYFFLPLAALFILRARQRSLTALEVAVAVMIGFILFYMLSGMGQTLSTFSLWSYVPAKRADPALGLACLMLTHLMIRPARKHFSARDNTAIAMFGLALVWAVLVYAAVRTFDEPLLSGANAQIVIGLIFMVIACSYFLLIGKQYAFLGLGLGLSLATTAGFHPLSIAPRYLKSPQAQAPILILASQVPAMFLFASGRQVVNGVFYYPQNRLWQQLDPGGRDVSLYNRYQHLIFTGQTAVEDVQISVPHPDIVKVQVNLQHLDFNRTGAGVVIAPESEQVLLSQNPTLSFERTEKGWSWFLVTPE